MRRFRWLAACVLVCVSSVASAQAPAPPVAIAAQVASAPVTLRIESISPIKIQSEGGPPWWVTLLPLIGVVLSGAFALGGVFWSMKIARDNTAAVTSVSRQTSEAAIWQKANEGELEDIQAKLDGFYMPFSLLAEANRLLAADVKSRQGTGYRLLIQLFDKGWRETLSAGDRELVKLICDNAEELRALIVAKSGLVDGLVLEYLSRASVHFRILQRAFKNELGEDPKLFNKYVYPRQLDGVLQLEIDRLKARADELRSSPGVRLAPAAPLVIPPDLKLPAWEEPAQS
jgi:hypothetical protein